MTSVWVVVVRADCASAARTMDTTKTDQALARLDTALQRIEAAVQALPTGPSVDAAEFEGLRNRHDHLKQSVASSLRKLDEILTGMPQ